MIKKNLLQFSPKCKHENFRFTPLLVDHHVEEIYYLSLKRPILFLAVVSLGVYPSIPSACIGRLCSLYTVEKQSIRERSERCCDSPEGGGGGLE